MVDALKVRHEQQETDRLAAGVEFWEDWGLVFTTGFGTPLSPRMTTGASNGWSAPPAFAMFGCTICGTPLLRSCWPRE